MVSRVLAILAAVGMIAGAYVYRYGIPGGDAEGGGGGTGGADTGEVICASELGPVCDAIEGATVEPAGATADRLSDARRASEANVGAWLAPGPWAAMVDEGRSLRSLPPLFEEEEVLASTPLVALVKKGKAPASCGGGGITWACLGQAAQDPANRVGIDDATRTTGLLVRAGILVGHFGTADFGSNDFPDAQATIDAFGERNREAVARGAVDLQRFLISSPDVPLFLTTRAASAANASVDVVAIAPGINVLATLARGDRGPGLDEDEVGEALAAAGWARGSGDAGELPSPGVLLALREAL